MPEAPVHKNHAVISRQDYIRGSGQVFSVQSESVSHSVKQFANAHFGHRIGATDPSHNFTSALLLKNIHDQSKGCLVIDVYKPIQAVH